MAASGTKPSYPPDAMRAAVSAVRGGATQAAAARAHGVTRSALSRAVNAEFRPAAPRRPAPDPEALAAAIAAVRGGSTVSAAAALHDITQGRLTRAARAAGALPPVRRLTDAERAAVAAAVAAVRGGLSVAEAVREHGAPESAVRHRCKALGLRTCGNAKLPSEGTLAALADLITTDLPMAAIAARRGVSRQRILQLRDKAVAAGIPVRPRTPTGGEAA